MSPVNHRVAIAAAVAGLTLLVAGAAFAQAEPISLPPLSGSAFAQTEPVFLPPLTAPAEPVFLPPLAAKPSQPPSLPNSKPVETDQQLLQKYVWSTLGTDGALAATIAAGVDQWQGAPPGWGNGGGGYAKRWASEFAEAAVSSTTKYAVSHFLHHDPSFTLCECSGFFRRLLHAVDSPFMARTRDNRRVLSAASVAGILAGNVVADSTWYPAPLGTRDGFKQATTSLLTKIGVDVFKEFWPHKSKVSQ